MAAIDDDGPMMGPCETCGGGGTASCCDTAGSAEPVFVCAACGAVQQHRMIKCEQCGEPLVFPKFAERAPSFTCPRCGAESFNPNDIRERYCGHCHAFVDDPPASYRDDTFPERLCDRCSQLYRGPAVYCSLKCALDDAA